MNTKTRKNDLDIRCTLCDGYSDDNSEWLELDVKGHEGDIVCETCQYDAAAHFCQIRDNIKHLGLFQNLIVQWAKE